MRRENICNIFGVINYVLAVFILSGVFLLPKNTFAQIIINEINWDGTEISSNDEWLELYNTGTSTITLDNYSLGWNNTNIDLSNLQINAQDFLLLERTDDETVPEISADLIYTGSLRNTGENLILKLNENIVDQADFSAGWPATDYISSSLQRDCNDLNIWQSATSSPKQINTICTANETEENIPSNATSTDNLNYTTSTKLFSITDKACELNDVWHCQNDNLEIFTNYISSTLLGGKIAFTSSTQNNIDILKAHYNNTDIRIFIFYLTNKIIGLTKNWLFFGNF